MKINNDWGNRMSKISVIIPAYNSEKHIEEAIESVINQTLKDIEIILVDDGSIDETLNICCKYSKLDKRIKVIHQKNKGISAARNIGIDNATGEYIAFLDSDDTIELTMYEELYNCLNQYGKEKPDFIDCGINIINLYHNTKNTIIHNHPKNRKFDREYLINEVIPQMVNIKNEPNKSIFPFIWNKLFKSSIINEYNIRFNEKLRQWEDKPFLVQFLQKANSVVFHEKSFYNYINRESLSLSKRYNEKEFETILYTFNLYEKLFCDLYDFSSEYSIKYKIKAISNTINKILHAKEEKNKKKKIKGILLNDNVQQWFNDIDNIDIFYEIIRYCINKEYFNICIYIYKIKFSKVYKIVERYLRKLFYLIKKFVCKLKN